MSVLFFCTGAVSDKESNPLFAQYLKYTNTVTESNIKNISSLYFSESILESGAFETDEVKFFVFHDAIQKVFSHVEKIDKKYGCLIINGYSGVQNPYSLRLTFKLEESGWLIDNVHWYLLDESSEFKGISACN